MSRFTQLALLTVLVLSAGAARAEDQKGYLENIHRHVTLTTTVPDNGDLNPYAIIVAPVSSGLIQKDDILIDNFNNISNLQGTGTTIVDYNPATKKASLIAKLPRTIPRCPGGVGLTTAMTMLKSGWIIVGSTPSTDGTTRTKGNGCLIVLDTHGKFINAVSGPNINDPWGNMAVVDKGTSATLFVSMAGFGVPGPEVRDPVSGFPVIIKKATVLRLELSIPAGKPPVFKSQTVIADGLNSQSNKDAFLIGPTGLVLGQDGKTLYVSDGVVNRVVAIPDATTRTTSAGAGREVTKGGLLQRPLAMIMAPDGHLLVTNAINGQVVEIDPAGGKQVYAQWIDADQAQSPPGNGDLFGLTLAPDGKGFYYVEDDMNTIVKSGMSKCPFDFTRRKFMALASGAAVMAGAGVGGIAAAHAGFGAVTGLKQPTPTPAPSQPVAKNTLEPFWGRHQSGIITPPQDYIYFAAFDIVTDKHDEVIKLLQKWTKASAAMTSGKTVAPDGETPDKETVDSGDVLGLPPSRLTITFGFGPGLFVKDGHDRFGLKSRRPEALVDMPKFNGDQLVEARTGGDLSIQACADNPQVAFHAVRQLARMADYIAQIRWTQSGFGASQPDGSTTRNLMGFKDGTGNPPVSQPDVADKFIWAGSEGPAWMQGGSYAVARRIRIALEHWDKMKVSFQEQTFGRQKLSGAPLGLKNEMDPLDLTLTDKDGNLVIPENAHVRLATAATNDGAKVLRRSYSYNDGVSMTAERWPPWRQGMEYDAGLLFVCYQRDPRTGFIRIFDKMSKFDMLNQFTTHVGSALFACPPGAKEGEFVGQGLFV